MGLQSKFFLIFRKLILRSLFVYVVLIALLFLMQRSLIYVPDTRAPNYEALSQSGRPYEIASVTTEDGLSLNGVYFPAQAGKSVLLYFHGNGGNISHRFGRVVPYLDQGYGVLFAEYRGYGGNPGAPSEQGLYRDARAYYDWLIKAGVTSEQVVIYGESLGSGVGVEMAREHGAQALILETPFASLADAARYRYFFIPFLDLLIRDNFVSIDKIGEFQGPALFLIAERDEVLGATSGLRLFEAAQQPKLLKIYNDAHHNTVYEFGAASDVLEFLNALADERGFSSSP